jgi:hypothetical protein
MTATSIIEQLEPISDLASMLAIVEKNMPEIRSLSNALQKNGISQYQCNKFKESCELLDQKMKVFPTFLSNLDPDDAMAFKASITEFATSVIELSDSNGCVLDDLVMLLGRPATSIIEQLKPISDLASMLAIVEKHMPKIRYLSNALQENRISQYQYNKFKESCELLDKRMKAYPTFLSNLMPDDADDAMAFKASIDAFAISVVELSDSNGCVLDDLVMLVGRPATSIIEQLKPISDLASMLAIVEEHMPGIRYLSNALQKDRISQYQYNKFKESFNLFDRRMKEFLTFLSDLDTPYASTYAMALKASIAEFATSVVELSDSNGGVLGDLVMLVGRPILSTTTN